ncbi:MAG: transcription antitermination factor NusB [Gammaproteobacteria bacterium]|nr:transcription antitermination factor NusB [Gammaproteobacteria bacterium]
MAEGQPHKRHWSRRLVLQSLYQWQLAGHSANELVEQFSKDENWPKVDQDYYEELLRESISHAEELTDTITTCVEGSMARVGPVEKAILLYAAYEMRYRHEIPKEVVISEAIILCKKFGSDGGYKLVNGVLDQVPREPLD